MKKTKTTKKRNPLKILIKVFLITFLLYSLLYVACSEQEAEEYCPLKSEIRENFKFPIEKVAILFKYSQILSEKKQEFLKTEIGQKLVIVGEYYHYAASVFVKELIPKAGIYLQKGKEYLVQVVFPIVKENVKIGAKFTRKITREYYPKEFINHILQFSKDKISLLKILVLDLGFVKNLQKNQKIMEIYEKVEKVLQDFGYKIFPLLGQWLYEYPSLGFDFIWRVLEDDVSGEEFDKITDFIRNSINFIKNK